MTNPATQRYPATGQSSVFDPRLGCVELGAFRLIGLLGEGSFATAYLAEQLGTERQAVVKIAHRHLVRGSSAVLIRERFVDETRAATRVDHPNLVTLYTTGETSDGLPAIAMEFVPGDTLEAHLARKAPLPPAELSYFVQVASALATLHRFGIVHRDVSPGNIMITRDHEGEPKATLLDFGIARVTGSKSQTLGAVGTPRYIAPEQILGHAVHASDVFGLGAMLWWALTGAPYLAHIPTVGALLNHQLNADSAPDPRTVAPALHTALARLTQRMLHPDARQRPTADALANLLPDVFAEACPESDPSHRPASGTVARTYRALRILVVEPNPVKRHLVGGFTQRLGCRVTLTEDPRDATRAQRGEHDVVVLATELPGVDAVAVAQHLSEHFPDQHLVLMAAEGQSVMNPADVGAEALLAVPGELTWLADYLRSLQPSSSQGGEACPAVGLHRPLSDGAMAAWDEPSTRDLSTAIEAFIGNMPEWLTSLDQVLTESPGGQVFAACHEIESAAGRLGAVHLAGLARSFRLLAQADELPEPRGFLHELEDEYQRVFRELLRNLQSLPAVETASVEALSSCRPGPLLQR